ncbi:MAG TPA: LLM class flavin-dependent oxidoreductase [Thermomicrobiales bacterium]|nr:LLM class flavin-dependent oxidoreductase [Thermomicrobiales bacterium]
MAGERARPLKVGMMLPQAEGRHGGGTAGWAEMLAMARRAEEIGFDSIWTIDHFILAYPNQPQQGVWENWSLLAALAAATSRVELGPLVTPTSFHNPAMLAKIVDTIEEISGGRLTLGLGAGWVEREYQAMGLPYDHRVSRFEEAVQIIHGLLRTGAVDFEGRYYSARECELRPRGPRAGGPPILIGSSGERMLRIMARYGDAWNAFFSKTGNSPAGVAPLRDAVDVACRAEGRDPTTLARTITAFVAFDLPNTTGHPDVTTPLRGTPDEIAAELRAYAAEGISHIQIFLDPMTLAGVEAFAPVLEALDRRDG